MSEARLVFLTGATGFIGGRLAAALVERGYRLRCLVRDPARAGPLRALGAELLPGDVTDADSLARGLDGAVLAIHGAAIYAIGRVDAEALERTNVGGTRAFLDALRAAPVERALYISTTAALGPVGSGEGDERSRYDGPFPTVYHRTKTRAHELALAAQAEGLPLVIACPALVYGPGRSVFGDALEDLFRGRLPALPMKPAWHSFVHVDDVANGLVSALERGRVGETYVLSGEAATMNDALIRAAHAGGVRAPRFRIPSALGRLTGSAADLVSRVTGRTFTISRESIAVSTDTRWLYSHAKATRDLEYHPRSLDAGLPETVRWVQSRVEAAP